MMRPCPPWSQVAHKLTSPFSSPPHPHPVPNSHPPGQLCAALRRYCDSGFSWSRTGRNLNIFMGIPPDHGEDFVLFFKKCKNQKWKFNNLFCVKMHYLHLASKSSYGVCSTYVSMARYSNKVPKTVLHKPTANSGINIFYKKCIYKYYLQLL